MSEPAAVYGIRTDDKVRVRRHPEWGTGEVLRVSQTLGVYQAKVLFKAPEGERVENLPIEWLEKAADLWERLAAGDFDDPEDYRIRQMALGPRPRQHRRRAERQPGGPPAPPDPAGP